MSSILRDQRVDVVAVDRRDEGLVQRRDTACVISSHSCSICLTRSARLPGRSGCSTISRKARQPSTVFFPWCSKSAKKDASCGSNLMRGVYIRANMAKRRSSFVLERALARAAS